MNKKASGNSKLFPGHFFPKGKKAIELSINFLVIIIISMTMLTLGIILINKFFGAAIDIQERIDRDTEARINAMLTEGQRIAIPFKKVISKGESDFMWVGILNVLGNDAEFNITITLSSAFNDLKQDISTSVNPHPDTWLLFNPSFELETKKIRNLQVNVDVPGTALSGTYIYNVEVTAEFQKYPIAKLSIIVP